MVRIAVNQRVRVRRSGDDEWTEGYLSLVSENFEALGIMLNGPVRGGDGFILNALPLLYSDKLDAYIGVLTSDSYDLEIVANA